MDDSQQLKRGQVSAFNANLWAPHMYNHHLDKWCSLDIFPSAQVLRLLPETNQFLYERGTERPSRVSEVSEKMIQKIEHNHVKNY